MIVYLHMRTSNGVRDPALAPYYGATAPYHRGVPASEIRHVYVNENHSMQSVVAAVTQAVGRVRSLWRLMINCHGTPGRIRIGSGLTVQTVRAFSALRPYMTPGGSGILVGCCLAAAGRAFAGTRLGCIRSVSSDDNGLTLLMELACQTDAKVIGALDEQVTWELNGPVLTVLPNRTFSISMGRTVDWIHPGMSVESYECPQPAGPGTFEPARNCG